jgi:hypothetical protein
MTSLYVCLGHLINDVFHRLSPGSFFLYLKDGSFLPNSFISGRYFLLSLSSSRHIALSSHAQSFFDPKFAFCTSLCPISSVYYYTLLALTPNKQTMVSSNATLPSISTFPSQSKNPQHISLYPSLNKQYTQPAYT